MSNQVVKNSTTGSMGVDAAKRSRFEKAETAFGKIPAGAYATGDTLIFTEIPARQIIHGRLVTSEGAVLEIFNKTDYSNALAWTFPSSVGTNSLDIHYAITYIRGTGKAHAGLANVASEVSGEQGVLLQVAVTIT